MRLRTLGLDAEPQFEVAFADIDAPVKHAENQLEEWLVARAEGGGGLSDEQMIKFIRALPTAREATNDTFDDTAKVGAAAAAESKVEDGRLYLRQSLHTEHRAPKTAGVVDET